MEFLTKTIKNCKKDLIQFLIILIIIWLAFVQLIHLFYNEKTNSYSTLIKSMETSFLILLGKFELKPLVQSNYAVGALIFSFYNCIVLILMVNLMMTILSDHFSKTKMESKLIEKTTVFDHLLNKLRLKLKLKQPFLAKVNGDSYIEINEVFELRTQELVNNLKKQIQVQTEFVSELNNVMKY